MESIWDDASSLFHENLKFFESDTIFVTFKSVIIEIFGKCSKIVGFDANNNLQRDLKILQKWQFWKLQKFCIFQWSTEPGKYRTYRTEPVR